MKIVTVVAAFGLLLALVNADPVTAQEQVEERRPIAFEASQAFGYDDNLMRLPDAALLPGFATDRGSALSRTRAMATFDQTWSLQRVRAAASGEAVRFGALSDKHLSESLIITTLGNQNKTKTPTHKSTKKTKHNPKRACRVTRWCAAWGRATAASRATRSRSSRFPWATGLSCTGRRSG